MKVANRLVTACMLWSIVGGLAACATTSSPPAALLTDPAMLQARVQATAPMLQGISAEAKVDQRGEEGRIRGSVMMFVRRGGEVRFDVMTQFGPALILTSDGQRFALSDLREHRFLTGPTCAQNIARLLRMPLNADQASRVLLGEAPEMTVAQQSLSFKKEEGVYLLSQRSADGHRQELRYAVDERDVEQPVERQRFRLVDVHYFAPDGSLRFAVAYEDHRPLAMAGGKTAVLPFRVHVTQPASDTDTLVKFKDIQTNPEIPTGVFQQEVPAGLEPEEALCE